VTWGITGNRNSYVAAPDGKRFLAQYMPEQTASESITIVQNWQQKLKATSTRPPGQVSGGKNLRLAPAVAYQGSIASYFT